tara:strand:- start:20 stop:142 length:123 start_codon:yes stop_codon:yes gene_type:complete
MQPASAKLGKDRDFGEKVTGQKINLPTLNKMRLNVFSFDF